jgi:hypothetical protein
MRITHEEITANPILNSRARPESPAFHPDSGGPCPFALGGHAERLIVSYSVMHFKTSCTAPLELLRCSISHYIRFNDEASSKG